MKTSDGASLWTVAEGEGPPMLFCHGGPGLWDYLGGLSRRVALGVQEKWVVLGHSWGAYLALLTAVIHPETTAGLVYIAGNGTPDCWREKGRAIANARTVEAMTTESHERLTQLEDRARTWHEEIEFRRLKFMTDFVDQTVPPPELEEIATTPLGINFAVSGAASSG